MSERKKEECPGKNTTPSQTPQIDLSDPNPDPLRAESSDTLYNPECQICRNRRERKKVKHRRRRRKKRYFLLVLLGIICAYCLKAGYERTFKRTVIMALANDLLNTKWVVGLCLSDSTRQNILQLAELVAASPSASGKEAEAPGARAKMQGTRAKHPVTIVPGIANTNLELWQTSEKSNGFFRKRIWGSHSTLTFMLHNRSEWFASMKLDERTGLDPDGVKVRPAQGLDSSDFSIPGLWFWWKIIENLSQIGYDTEDVHFAAFDWRLGMEELESRDRYFTKLKRHIEQQILLKREKAVIVAHSLGALVFHYFMQWVSNGDPSWVADHVHSVVYLAAPLLGAPKAVSCLLSGEARDTAQMGAIQYAIVELLFGKEQRRELFKTWTSALHLLPKGGSRFWGGPESGTGCPNPISATSKTLPSVSSAVTISASLFSRSFCRCRAGSRRAMVSILHRKTGRTRNLSGPEIHARVKSGVSEHSKKVLDRILSPVAVEDTWTNPLLSPLPHAPELSVYLFYGTNIPTETAYFFIEGPGEALEIHKGAKGNESKSGFSSGVFLDEGDGTVPLISCGYMGVKGWKTKRLNPSGAAVVVKEYVHVPSKSILEVRGGPFSSQHVNILGNHEVISDLLVVASGGQVPPRITSNIQNLPDDTSMRTS